MEKGMTKMKKKRRFSLVWLERKGGRKIVRWGGGDFPPRPINLFLQISKKISEKMSMNMKF